MIEFIRNWYEKHFSNPQVIILVLLVAGVFAIIMFFGDILAPVIAAVVLTYVLEGLVARLVRFGIPRLPAVIMVSLLFIGACAFIFLGALPMLTRQIAQLVRDLPAMLGKGQEYLLLLPEKYPALFSEAQIQSVITGIRNEMLSMGHEVVSFSLAGAVGIFTFLAYLMLITIMVFFGLKDKAIILAWFERLLPERRELSKKVWHDVDIKIGSYIRGKIIEILIIWAVSYLVFAFMGLQYGMLLSFLVGISVIIPYVGAFAVTIPVAVIAYYQWGLEVQFWYLIGAYLVIQALDGNVLVPILFSEVVNLHPVAIVGAIVFFGGLWGLWGIFFAIPLATLVDAILNAWPRLESKPPAAAVDE